MSLSAEQQTTLANAIKASTDQRVIDALVVRNDAIIAEVFNEPSTFWVWRSTVSVEEYRQALVWTEVDALTVGKARIWDWVTGAMTLPLEANKLAVRQGLADCWSAQSTTRANLLAIAKRLATQCEALFATGTGTSATPGDLGVEITLSTNDVSFALNANP